MLGGVAPTIAGICGQGKMRALAGGRQISFRTLLGAALLLCSTVRVLSFPFLTARNRLTNCRVPRKLDF